MAARCHRVRGRRPRGGGSGGGPAVCPRCPDGQAAGRPRVRRGPHPAGGEPRPVGVPGGRMEPAAHPERRAEHAHRGGLGDGRRPGDLRRQLLRGRRHRRQHSELLPARIAAGQPGRPERVPRPRRLPGLEPHAGPKGPGGVQRHRRHAHQLRPAAGARGGDLPGAGRHPGRHGGQPRHRHRRAGRRRVRDARPPRRAKNKRSSSTRPTTASWPRRPGTATRRSARPRWSGW